MIKVKLGDRDASIDDRVWTSSDSSLEKMLNSFASSIFIHSGHPDIDLAIVQQIQEKNVPLVVISNDRPPREKIEYDGDEVII